MPDLHKPLTDPREIRKLLQDVGRGRGRIDSPDDTWGMQNAASSLIHIVDSLAYHAGLSGEDHMTLLAYHALLQLERVMGKYIDMVSIAPSQPTVMPRASTADDFEESAAASHCRL